MAKKIENKVAEIIMILLIIVDYNNNPYWPGYGSVEVLSDGPNGYNSFKSHQENPFLFISEREEYLSGEYELIIK